MHKKTAIVYDWIDKWGGVERVLLTLHRMFPDAPFFTSLYNPLSASWAQNLTIIPSFLRNVPRPLQKRALLVPLYPIAFESFDFSMFDTVISVTSSFAKGIITKPQTRHLSYVLTPPRFLWSHKNAYGNGGLRALTSPVYAHLQSWDMLAAKRPDKLVAISDTARTRCMDIYKQESTVVYPPFDTDYWDRLAQNPSSLPPRIAKPYYLAVGRMERYKRFDLVIQAAQLRKDLFFVLVGTGTQQARLMRTAPKNCLFLDHITDQELVSLYAHAEGLLMPQEEDFGYVALEAQYHGCPVLAYGKGGATETVEEGETGLFFREQTAVSLVAQLARLGKISYNLKRSLVTVRQKVNSTFGEKRFETDFFYQLSTLTR